MNFSNYDLIMNDFITVATFTYFHELGILKSMLEAEGIPCFVADDNVTSANPFYSNAVGGIKLKVKKEDIVKAIRVKEAYEQNNQVGTENYDYHKSEKNKDNTLKVAVTLFILLSIILIIVSLIFRNS